MNRKQRRAAGKQGAPADLDALLGRAADAARAGDLDRAEALYRQLIAARPGEAMLYARLGDLAERRGDFSQAIDLFRQAIALKPGYAEAHMRLGNALLTSGRPVEAIAPYRAAIALAPTSAETHSNLGTALVKLELFEEGIAAHQKSVALKPDFAVGYFNLGNALLRAGRMQESVGALQKVIELKPDMAQAHSDLGNVLYLLGQRDQAIVSYRNAIAIDPNFAEAYSNLANPLTDEGRLDEALAMTIKSIQLNPNRPEAHSNFGNVLVSADRVKESLAPYRHALTLKPDYAEAHCNLGHAFGRLGQWDDSIAAFRAAIKARPDYAEAHLYLGIMLLRQGIMAEGWREYEWRWSTALFKTDRIENDAPLWRGEPLAGKAILLHSEQGLGDTIQFIRYAKILADRGARVIVAVPPALVRLARRVPGVADVITIGEGRAFVDYRLPFMSLPRLLGPELADIPRHVPYISATGEAWQARLADLPGLKVGLVWAGAPRAHDRAASMIDRRRSLHLSQLAPLFAVPGVSFISLQKGDAGAQISEGAYPVRDFMDQIDDFADTADLVAALDLVIAVDTSVAHIAGAIGKPVWILSRFDGCWRWLDQGDSTAWYPTARLFRQPAPMDWTPVVDQVAAALGREMRSTQ